MRPVSCKGTLTHTMSLAFLTELVCLISHLLTIMLIFPLSTENCCNLLLIVLTSESRLRLSLNLSLLNIIWVILPNEHVVATLVTV